MAECFGNCTVCGNVAAGDECITCLKNERDRLQDEVEFCHAGLSLAHVRANAIWAPIPDWHTVYEATRVAERGDGGTIDELLTEAAKAIEK